MKLESEKCVIINSKYIEIELIYYGNDILTFKETSTILPSGYYGSQYKTTNYYDIYSYFSPSMTYIVDNSESDEVKNQLKNEIFINFSEYLNDVINLINNDKNENINKFDIKINNYKTKYNDLLKDIDERVLIKHSDCIIIDNIKNIEKYIKKRNNLLLKYNNKINELQKIIDFSKNYIRNQKLNKIIDES